ncbi:MAG: radical SAM protein [Thermodesulfobacteriota bacterium]
MKVALVVPPMPYTLEDAPELQFPPLAICYLGAVLREAGHEVALADMTVSNMTFNELRSKLGAFRPQVVGISAISASFTKGVAVARLVKELDPKITVLMGGMHPTFSDRSTLEQYPVDIVVRNEGESTVPEVLAKLGTGADGLGAIDGISYKDESGAIQVNPPRAYITDLDRLPLPAYDLLDTMPIYARLREFLVVTSRGCPFRCIFCSSSPFWGHRWRVRSVEHVIAEIDLLVDRYGAKNLVFGDDNFSFNNGRVFDLCAALQAGNYHLDWRCSVRADSLTKPLLQAMRDSGCSGLFMGVESGSQRSLDLLGKRARLEDSLEAVRLCREVGIETTCAMLMGLPWETEEDIRDNIAFVTHRLQPHEVVWNLLHPDPGSELFEKLGDYGLRFVIDDPERHIGNAPSVIATRHLTVDQLNQLWMEACFAAGVGEEE